MRSFTTWIATAFLAALTACNSPHPVELGEPVTLKLPAGMITGPRLTERPDGGLVLSWMAQADDGGVLRYAAIAESQLGPTRDVANDERMFVNWADLPSVLQVEGNYWLAHWLRYSADTTYSYDVVVSQSFDDGATWSEPVLAHEDGTPTEHGFVSMFRASDGVALLWLDGRSTPDAPMTLRSAVITPGGERQREQLVDASVCDCCQTDIAISSKGPIAVYRDRTPDEVRDIYITRYSDGKWEPGTRLYADDWNIAGCPVNGPSIAADGDDVAVAWFSAANDAPVVRVRLSNNGSRTFGTPIEISAGRIAGYVGLTFIENGTLAVSWVARSTSGANKLQVRLVSMDGVPGETREVADIQQIRVFPQLGYQNDHLFLFWTDQAGNERQLRGVRVPVT